MNADYPQKNIPRQEAVIARLVRSTYRPQMLSCSDGEIYFCGRQMDWMDLCTQPLHCVFGKFEWQDDALDAMQSLFLLSPDWTPTSFA